MKGLIRYKGIDYSYEFDYFDEDFNNFMNSEIFRILIKDIRESRKKEDLCIEVERNVKPCYIFGEFAGLEDNGTFLKVNGNPVDGIPDYAIIGLMNYVDKYVGWGD